MFCSGSQPVRMTSFSVITVRADVRAHGAHAVRFHMDNVCVIERLKKKSPLDISINNIFFVLLTDLEGSCLCRQR